MTAGGDDFESWLSLKLQALNMDEGVFGTYITGFLEEEEALEDKTEVKPFLVQLMHLSSLLKQD